MPRRRTIDPGEAARWDTIRARATKACADIEIALDRAKADTGDATETMELIAHRSQFPEREPFDDELRVLINRAQRDERRTWAEITAAMGEPADARHRVQARQSYRNRLAGD